MPIYKLTCERCGDSLEQYARLPDDKITICPKCGGQVKQVWTPFQIRLKTGKLSVSPEFRNKYTRPHRSNDAPKGTMFSFPKTM